MTNYFISIFHFFLVYIIFIGTLITNDLSSLLLLLILMCVIKCGFYFFDRCILTILEKNEMVSMLSFFLVNHELSEKETEEIIINIGTLMLLNKIIVLMFIEYYYSATA